MIYGTTLAVSQENITKDMSLVLRGWTDGVKHVIAHSDHPVELNPTKNGMDIPTEVSFTGTDAELLEWVKDFPHRYGAIYVVSNSDVVYDMEELKPSLVFYRIVINDNTDPKKQVAAKLRSIVESSIEA